MKNKLYALILFLSYLLTLFITAQRAQATLGESADSVASDLKTFEAARGTTMIRNGYTVQEIASDSVRVREYVSTSGVVFGIAWNGLIHPDLTQLLGSYANEYQEALQQTPRTPGRRSHQVKTDRVIVEKWGHMRNLQGRAYAPALIPPGVSVDEIH